MKTQFGIIFLLAAQNMYVDLLNMHFQDSPYELS